MRQWVAHYSDGTSLSQRGEKEHSYHEIDQTKLVRFVIEENGRPLYIEHIPEGGRLIFIMRTIQWGNAEDQKATLWLAGCQRTIRGVNCQHVAAIAPDGHVEMFERFSEGIPYLWEPDYSVYPKWSR